MHSQKMQYLNYSNTSGNFDFEKSFKVFCVSMTTICRSYKLLLTLVILYALFFCHKFQKQKGVFIRSTSNKTMNVILPSKITKDIINYQVVYVFTR